MRQQEDSQQDRRRYPRFAISSSALVVDHQGISNHCIVENISAGGLLITGSPVYAVGEPLHILLRLPGHKPFRMDGQVVRHHHRSPDDTAIGIAFHHTPTHIAQTVDETLLEISQRAEPAELIVLVVDDSIPMCQAMVRDLKNLGRKAIAVTTPLDAIEWLLLDGEQFDTALVDWAVGHGAGYGLLTLLADEYPSVRRIMTSAPLQLDPQLLKSEITQSDAILFKPWSYKRLAQLISM